MGVIEREPGLRTVHFSMSDDKAGASKAAFRLVQAMRSHGIASRMFVKTKRTDDPDVFEVPVTRWRAGLRRILYRSAVRKLLLPVPRYTYNLDVMPVIDMRELERTYRGMADVACLHWVTEFLGIESVLQIHRHFRCPVVWVTMDMEPFTGGCHYSFGCEGYTKACGWCPLLGSDREKDHSRATWMRKRRLLDDLPLTFVAPTGWIETRVRKSSLFSGKRVERIPLSIDTETFRPADKDAARRMLGAPPARHVIFFGSSSLDDPRKGMRLLTDALAILAQDIVNRGGSPEDILLLVAGKGGRDLFSRLPFPHMELGSIDDDARLAMAYQAADLLVCPSTEDAGPMMIPEAALCGRPVVAFETGGAPDLVRPMDTGYLASPGDARDLARGILAVLEHPARRRMEEQARSCALALHSQDVVAGRYAALFEELVGG